MRITRLIFFLFLTQFSFGQSFKLSDTSFKVNDKLISRNILFEFARYELHDSSFKHLDSIVSFLKLHDSISIEIRVHCDERSSDFSSMNLTQRRAQKIKNYLITKRIDSKRLLARGFDKEKPIIIGAKTEEEHQMNRRSEFIITEIKTN